jgi:hypothetical protein
MSLQQNVGLYPFVYDIITVDPLYYPEISPTSVTSQSAPSFLLSDEYNIYGTVTRTVDDKSVLNIVRYQKQNYHQNYFTYEAVSDFDVSVSAPFNFGEQMQIDNNNLYLMYSTSSALYLNKYNIVRGNYDLSLAWSLDLLYDTPYPYKGSSYSRSQCGFMLETQSSGAYVYSYRLDASLVTLVRHQGSDGTVLGTGQTAVSQSVSDIAMVLSPNPIVYTNNTYTQQLGHQYNAYLISYTNNPTAQYVNLVDVMANVYTSPTAIQSLYNVPCKITAVAQSDMLTTFICLNGDKGLNSLVIANVTLDTVIGMLSVPSTNVIDKLTFLNEIFSSTQVNAYVTSCTNPLNPNFVYICYVTSTNTIRVVKFYRNNTGNVDVPVYSYLVMWATNVHAFGDYTVGAAGSTLSVTTDRFGVLYVMSYNIGSGVCKIWKVSEFQMDLGHTQGTLSAEANTIPNMLLEIDNLYTMTYPLLPLQMSTCPYITSTVPLGTIISNVTPGVDNMEVKFSYVNYDAFQLDMSLSSRLQRTINNGFNTLYQQSSLSVNIWESSDIIRGENNYIVARVPLLTSSQPCVAKGTEVIKYDTITKLATLVTVELLNVGDYVVNQHGRPIQILDHRKSTIYSAPNNSPYIVPAGFFAPERPYKQLYISGDHGILVDHKRHKMVYPYKLGFKRLPMGIFIEYHHLLLHNDSANCFIANGLEVDSLHLAPYI